ncbi:MAG TPA: NAD(P)/FAD-dependent oxidoreductase [Polyangiales bacterium]|nr:NAD(P)/FAD-dependent oxidoreductase [Polyangiales bacterium]
MDIDYDLVIAGGSIAGAALGFAAQRAGARVLIVEPETAFRDRVRGEMLHPWGVAEAQRLGLSEVLERAPVHAAHYWDTYIGGQRIERRDLAQTTSSRLTVFNAHHPELQAALLAAARDVGVEVRTGAKVVRIEPGSPAVVELARDGDHARVTARLAVIADGRQSQLRAQLGIAVTGERMPMLISGVLLEGVSCDSEAVGMFLPAKFGELALVLRLARDRVRLYFVARRDPDGQDGSVQSQPGHESDLPSDRSAQRRGYTGAAQLPAMLRRCMEVGVPESWLARARAIGPLATFETTCWSLRDLALPPGVALIGDAAGNVDPVFGCGQSLALRDVRHLVDAAGACRGDWQLAAAKYHHLRHAYHAALLRCESWMSRILYAPSPRGDAIRAAALPRLDELGIDLVGAGPDSPTDDATEARLFAGI